MTFLFDTNIIYHYLKKTDVMQEIESSLNPFQAGNECWLNVVSIGEIRSMALCNVWGAKRMKWVSEFLANLILVDIASEEVLNRYAEIEAFSQCRLPGKENPPFSPRNMGKNDLWIASTASVLEAVLITTDKDFDHLHNSYLDLAYFPIHSK